MVCALYRRMSKDFEMSGCECENIAHFHDEGKKLTPNGNPSHKYGVQFARHYLEDVQTPNGRFRVCRDCERDCMANRVARPWTSSDWNGRVQKGGVMETVSASTILDRLAEACKRFKMEGARGVDWTWDHMSSAERLAFDLFLVKMKDQLAYEPGTPEHRFRTRVQRMVKLSETGKL